MAVKKFFMTFAIIVFCFLVGAGVVLIQVINTAEAKALAETKEYVEENNELPDDIGEEADDFLGDYFDIKPFNTLILVRDKVGANTDAIMLVNVNTLDNKISVMSIPRDTIVSTDLNKDGIDNDIMNMVYANSDMDIEKTIEYIGKELNCKIKYGAVMKLKAFREVIDQLGGVDFNVPAKMDYDDSYQDLHIYFEAGLQHFDGEDAEKLLRFRKNNEDVIGDYWNGSDLKRIKMQQDFIKALIEQKMSILNAGKINNIIQLIFDDLNTNVKSDEILKHMNTVLKADLGNIEFFKLPVIDDDDFVHLIPVQEEIESRIKSNFVGLD